MSPHFEMKVRKTAEGAENMPENLPPHHLAYICKGAERSSGKGEGVRSKVRKIVVAW
jgi:hypothetical protein